MFEYFMSKNVFYKCFVSANDRVIEVCTQLTVCKGYFSVVKCMFVDGVDGYCTFYTAAREMLQLRNDMF